MLSPSYLARSGRSSVWKCSAFLKRQAVPQKSYIRPTSVDSEASFIRLRLYQLMHQRLFHGSALLKSHRDPETGFKVPPSGPQPGGNDPKEIFTDMNVLAGSPPPASGIEVVYTDGFLLSNGMKLRTNDGVLIVHNEAFKWLTKEHAKVTKGILELDEHLWGVLNLVSPKPELIILGTGARSLPVSPKTRNYLHSLGIRIDSMDTGNAASSYNMLATERPGQIIAAAMLPASFR